MAKKIILALIILILLIFLGIIFLGNNSVEVYNDGENVTVETTTFSDIDKHRLNKEICNYTLDVMNNTNTSISAYRHGIEDICRAYGLDKVKINIDSSIGPNQIPIIVTVDGTSMLPTAESDEYGGIIKRVDQIKGNEVHLISDNKGISYEYINGVLYEVSGITTWVDISDINGVVIQY